MNEIFTTNKQTKRKQGYRKKTILVWLFFLISFSCQDLGRLVSHINLPEVVEGDNLENIGVSLSQNGSAMQVSIDKINEELNRIKKEVEALMAKFENSKELIGKQQIRIKELRERETRLKKELEALEKKKVELDKRIEAYRDFKIRYKGLKSERDRSTDLEPEDENYITNDYIGEKRHEFYKIESGILDVFNEFEYESKNLENLKRKLDTLVEEYTKLTRSVQYYLNPRKSRKPKPQEVEKMKKLTYLNLSEVGRFTNQDLNNIEKSYDMFAQTDFKIDLGTSFNIANKIYSSSNDSFDIFFEIPQNTSSDGSFWLKGEKVQIKIYDYSMVDGTPHAFILKDSNGKVMKYETQRIHLEYFQPKLSTHSNWNFTKNSAYIGASISKDNFDPIISPIEVDNPLYKNLYDPKKDLIQLEYSLYTTGPHFEIRIQGKTVSSNDLHKTTNQRYFDSNMHHHLYTNIFIKKASSTKIEAYMFMFIPFKDEHKYRRTLIKIELERKH